MIAALLQRRLGLNFTPIQHVHSTPHPPTTPTPLHPTPHTPPPYVPPSPNPSQNRHRPRPRRCRTFPTDDVPCPEPRQDWLQSLARWVPWDSAFEVLGRVRGRGGAVYPAASRVSGTGQAAVPRQGAGEGYLSGSGDGQDPLKLPRKTRRGIYTHTGVFRIPRLPTFMSDQISRRTHHQYQLCSSRNSRRSSAVQSSSLTGTTPDTVS